MYVTISSGSPHTGPSFIPNTKSPHALPTMLTSGQYLYYEGDHVSHVYQVASGVVRLTRLLEDGRRQIIAFGFPGDIIGFPADECYHTDCDALVDSTLQAYDRSSLVDGDGDPKLHLALMQAALNEISAMQDHFLMLGRKTAGEKVASFLNVITKRYGKDFGDQKRIKLPMARSDIADFLGLTTETVSRAFSALRRAGIIDVKNAHIVTILDPVALLNRTQGDH